MTTPAGFLWTPYTNLRTALSQVAAFQSWLGVATAELALARIFLFETYSGLETFSKFAVILPGTEELNRDTAGTGLAAFSLENTVKFGLLEKVEYSEAAATGFLNNCGSILDGLLQSNAIGRWQKVRGVPFGKEATFKWADGPNKGYQKYFEAESKT